MTTPCSATYLQPLVDHRSSDAVISCHGLNLAPCRAFVLAATLIAGSVILLWPAILNGYPLVYWDTGAYIWSWLDRVVPADRPIGYSLFVAATGGVLHTLWGPVAVQALVTTYLVIRLLMNVVSGTFRRRVLMSLAVLVLTASTTGIVRYVSFVMPDIPASWIVLGGLLLVLGKRWVDRTVAAVALLAAVLMHNSNVFLSVAFGAVLLLAAVRRAPSIRRQHLRDVVVVTFLAIACTGLLNWLFGAGFTLSRGSATFMVNRLAATGVLSQTLETYCPAAGWQLCASQDVIRQAHADPGWWFLWGDDSPLRVLGWEQAGGEQSDVARHALLCCLGALISASAESSWQQMQRFRAAQDLPRLDDQTGAYNAIRLFYPRDFSAFLRSRQQSGALLPVPLLLGDDPTTYALFATAAALVAASCWRRGLAAATLILVVVLVSVLLNAIIVGALNGADDRQQGRVVWLLPFALWVGLLGLAADKPTADTRAPGQ